jgi:hypothetical protein
MTENCCLKPYTPAACDGGVSWEGNETLNCYVKSRCQQCVMSMGFSDSGCLRCCAVEKASCSSSDDFFSSGGLTAWAVAVLIAVGVCFIFTIIYLLTSKKRNEGVHFRAFTSHSYFVALPEAKRGDLQSEAKPNEGDDSDEEVALADSVFLVNKTPSDADVVPVARRTVPPVVAVRRTLTPAQSQNIFFLDVQTTPSPN